MDPPSGQSAVFERAFRTLLHANRVLLQAVDEEQLLAEMCRTIVERAGYSMVYVAFAERDEAKSVRIAARHGDVGYLDHLRVSWDGESPYGRGPTGTALRTGQVEVVHDTDTEPSFAPWRDLGRQFNFRSTCALPFDANGSRGALCIYAGEVNAFDPPAYELFKELAANLSFGIDRLRSMASMSQSLKSTVEALSAAVELRDPFTAGHQRRVAALARAICNKIGVSAHDAEGIWFAGIVHDIGKLGVPIEILTTVAPLTQIQYAIIQVHPEYGKDIIEGIDFPWPVADWVFQHHERIDGSGYPMRLRGDEVLLGARIISVADVYESMASDRPYRRTKGHDAAIKEIRAGAGRRYDADAADACIAVMEESNFTFLDQIGPVLKGPAGMHRSYD